MRRTTGAWRIVAVTAVLVPAVAGGAGAAERVKAPSGRFTFVAPAGWERQVEGASLVHYHARSPEGATITIGGQSRPATMTLEKTIDDMLNYYKDVFENLKVLSRSAVKVGTHDGVRLRCDYDVEKPRAVVRTRWACLAFFADNRLQLVEYTAPTADFNKASKTYDAVAASVRFPGEPEPKPEPKPEPVEAPKPRPVSLRAFKEGGKYGYRDAKKKVVIAPRFEDARDFSEGLGAVMMRVGGNKRYGFVNAAGAYVIEPTFAYAHDFRDGLARVQVWVNAAERKWGYVDYAGTAVVKPQFEKCEDFCRDFARAQIDGRWRWIDRTGTPHAMPAPAGRVVTRERAQQIQVRQMSKGSLVLSPDGRRLATVISRDGKKRLIVDSKEIAAYAGMAPPAFSPDGTRLACRVGKSRSEMGVFIDGAVKAWYKQVGQPVFSPDGKRLAYVATDGTKTFVVVNGEAGPGFDAAGGPLFSPDGKRLAYVIKDGAVQRVVVDGAKGPSFKAVDTRQFLFSANGATLAYVAVEGDKRRVVFGGKGGPLFAGVTDLTVSADGTRYAHEIPHGDRTRIVLDGAVETRFETSGYPVFSPVGKRFAFRADVGDKQVVVLDGKAGPMFDAVFGLTFSPDGKRFAHTVKEGTTYRLVLDGRRGGTADGYIADLTFSPDGARLACTVGYGRKRRVVAGDRRHAPYDEIGDLFFSPDGKHLVYVAKDRALDRTFVIVDGAEGSWWSAVARSHVFFSSPTRFHYFGVDKKGDLFNPTMQNWFVEEAVR